IPSEFIPLIESINEMLERIDRSFHQANRFAADASHELRTPLTILQGHLEKLIQAEPDSTPLRQEEYANLLGEVNRLQRLSTQLLFLARSDSGHFKIERKSVNLNPELEELIEDYEDLYPDFRFKLKIPDSKKVSVDWPLLRQAVVNLLSNAVIYSNDIQSITLDYFYENDHFTISVKNHGEPIADDIAQRLFDRFYRAEESRTRKAGASGTGLGLSLANECVKAHGGSISYKGNSQGINRFDIEIPLAK
ncbi:MAG: ATP-binding protein, partial [Verrucomicrobiota bacterium]